MKCIANSKGQTLLFVVVAMTIAIVVVLGVAARMLSSTSRVSETNTSSKAYAAAESGAERFLILSDNALDNVLSSRNENIICPFSTSENIDGIWGCSFELPNDESVPLKAKAFVSVSEYTFKENSDHINVEIPKGAVHEVNIKGYSADFLDICWNGNSYIEFGSYSSSTLSTKTGVKCNSCSVNSADTEGFLNPDPSVIHNSYTNCVRAPVVSSSPQDRLGFRVRSIHETINLGVYPLSDDLPTQGYKITSVGTLLNDTETEKISRIVNVYKSRSYPAGPMDFVLFSNTGSLE